jgi:hypothetical protein
MDDTVVPPGGIKTVDVALAPAGKLSGRVLAPNGAGAVGMQVRAYSLVDREDYRMWEPVENVTTAADGSCEIGGIAPGEVRLGVTDPPLWRYARIFYGGALVPELAADVSVAARHADIALSADRGSIRGFIRDTHGSPLATADAGVHIPDPEVGDYRVDWEYAASDGSYQVDGLPYGDHLVWFNERMMVPNVPMWYEDDPFGMAPTIVTVGPSGTRPAVVDAALPMPSHIRGTVHGSSGGGTTPLQDAWMSAMVTNPADPASGWVTILGCSTDATGPTTSPRPRARTGCNSRARVTPGAASSGTTSSTSRWLRPCSSAKRLCLRTTTSCSRRPGCTLNGCAVPPGARIRRATMRLDYADGEYRPQWLGIHGPKESA